MLSLSPSRSTTTPAPQLLARFGIERSHLQAVARLGQREDVQPEQLVAAFYEWLAGQPWMDSFFAGGIPGAVRSGQVQYWYHFLSGLVDEDYVAGRSFVGETHARIGLPPEAHTSAMAFSQRYLVGKVLGTDWPPADQIATLDALSRLCQLDLALVMDAYAAHSNRLVQNEADKLGAINAEVTRVVAAASRGDFRDGYHAQADTDAELAQAVNGMVESLRSTVRQVKAVAAGDYSDSVTARSDDDELGSALAEMTSKLREATARNERDQWLQEGQAQVFERMRGELASDVLARGVLAYLAERLQAPVGCVYVVEGDGELRSVATYGAAASSVAGRLAKGEGVVGEVALRGEPLFDLDVSAHPVRGSYGLGEIILDHVAVVPLVGDGQVRGVLQLASREPLPEFHRALLSLVAENFAIGLAGAESRLRMQELLEESRRQQEELQSQTEELRVSNEELEERSQALAAAQQDMERQNVVLRQQQLEVEKSRAELEHRAKQLSVAGRYKSEFLANMSHELRTPLNSMLILAEGLGDNPDGNLTDRQVKAAQTIRDGGQDLLRIINDILDLSKVEAGKLSIEVQPLALGNLGRNLRRQFEPVADKKGLTLQFDIDPRAPLQIESDPYRVEQILRNLLSNAIKFTSEGSVQVRVAVPGASAPPGLDGGVAISVSDTGIGIDAEHLGPIFEAFQQGDGSTSRKYGGTGLGLTISAQLTALLGGDLRVESEPGHGSTFTLLLPSRSPGPLAAPSRSGRFITEARAETEPSDNFGPADRNNSGPHTGPANDGRPLLLVVEDDPAFRTILTDLIEARGYIATSTGSGREALVLAQRLKPSGVVLDLGLADLDGLQVLEQLKHHLDTRAIPVQVISGHDCRPDTLQLGAVGFLQKPATHDQLDVMIGRFEALWARSTRRMLLVEDDSAAREAIRGLLGAEELEIVDAGSGAEGLTAMADGAFDCVVVDLGLPDMDGSEFLARLGEDHPPVVVYTGRELSDAKLDELSRYTKSVVVKGARSPERLLDEVSLFLHQVEDSLTDRQRATIRALHDPKASLDGRSVLVVDDDMRNLFAMTELLQRQGLEVIKAKNGQAALDRLEERPGTDLVIMDIMMPVMDGFEAMRRIRAQQRFASLPIIAVTAKTLPEDRQACLDAGASDYVTKPMNPDNLLALMRVLLFDAGARPLAGERGQDVGVVA